MATVWSADVSEINKVAIDLRGAGLRAQLAAPKVVAKAGYDTEATAKGICPVDTGNLRNSIGTDITDGGYAAEVGPKASYAPFVEYGTSRMAPQAFMGPAFDRHSGEFVDALSQLAGKSLWP